MSDPQVPTCRIPGERPMLTCIGLAATIVLGGCSSSPPPAAEPRSSSPTADVESPPTTVSASAPVRTLAKVEGWRPGLVTPPDVFSALEIAYDADTAQRMWQENVPVDLAHRRGDPLQFGVYGELGSVDFTDYVVALWSSGQSGSCPGWASAIRSSAGGDLVVEEDVETGGNDVCSDDRRVYRTLIVAARDQVPVISDLGSATSTYGESDSPRPVLLAAYAGS